MVSTVGMSGELQTIAGKAQQEVKRLGLAALPGPDTPTGGES
jgi:hypothetical protein